MNTDILAIALIYVGIGIIAWIINRWFGRIRLGVLGLVLIIQPVAMATYREMNPWIVLSLVVIGILLLTGSIARSRST